MAYKGVALILLYSFAFVSIVSSQTCSAGWSLIAGRCYKVFEGSKTWFEAQQTCQSYGGDLVVIKSTDLQNELTLMVLGSLGSYWIGLQYDYDAGEFIWVDSTSLNNEIARWRNGEPNGIGSGEDCVEMYGSGLWNDAACGSSGGYICDRGTDVLKKCDEDNDWVSFNGKCYKWYETPESWEVARTYCKNVYGDLIDVNSAGEQNVVTAASQYFRKTFWIGLTNKYYDADTYMWSTGVQLTYTNWGDNEPASRHFNDGGDCAEVLDTAQSGEWITAKCTDPKSYVCEKNEGTCPPGWRIYKGSCYQFNSNQPLTYTDAKHYCEAQGTFLVSIFSGEENDFIVTQFQDLANVGVTDIWIGIADYPTDDVFIWSDNSAVTFTNWKANEPTTTPNQHDCGMIYTDDSSGQWNTDNCFVLKAHVCKVRAGQNVYSVSPNLAVGVCPAGWNLFGDSCYYSDTSQLDWNSAETYCTNQNSHLVAINDDDEQSYISMRLAYIGVDTWIGLHDSGNRNNYVWTDGSSLDITNWADGNPDYPPSGEACVVAKAQDNMEGLWDDMACTTTRPFICEKPKECETLTTFSTDTNFYYRYHPSPLPSNRVEFEVKAESDVHVTLTTSNTGQGQMYEIVIGGWTNTQSVIRLCGGCAHEAQVSTVGILSGSEFRGFWITYESNGHIAVGKYGEGIPFMQWTDPNPFQVNYIGYSTGYGFSGEFKFCNLDSGSSGTGSIVPTAAFDPRCGSGWEYDSTTGNCYLFKPSDYKTWYNAELACKKGGGYLVSINGLEEMSYINSRLAVISESLLWIGATDASEEGGWKWSDNSAFRYLNWAAGEPNLEGEEDHCAQMYVNTGLWSDVYCTKSLGYICKKDGYLVDHFNVNHDMYIDGYDNLQLSDMYPEDCAKQCVQQTGFVCRSFEYDTETMQCSLSDASAAFSGALLTYKENTDYYERPVGEQCLPGWDLFQSKCYYFDKYASKTWYEAREECQLGGGDLALVKTAAVNNYMTTQIVSLDGAYFFGLHDLSDEGDFEWVDGTKLVDTGFSRWDLRQPDNYGEAGEDCVVMWTSGLWNDRSCTSKAGLMCDQNSVYDVSYPEVTPTLPSVYRCPNGWHTFGDNCYLIQLNTGSWQNARDQCRSIGADLASIDNNSENDYLAALITQSGMTGPLTHVWIGLNDLRVPLTFEWSDDSEVLFTNWNENEPNNFLGADEDCVEMDGAGAWNDERCISINPSICEMSKEIIEGTAPPATPSGCDLGWVAYGSSCYGLPGKISATWADAQSNCEDLGGSLASIKDRYEQTVVTSLLSSEDGGPIWIGLNDIIVAGEYHWSDGSAVTYTHWDYQEPRENNGNCVASTSGSVAGLWQVKDCDSRYDYLCEKVREGYTAAPTVTPPGNPTTPHDGNCADGWIGYGDKCFRVYDFGDRTRNMRSWQLALSQCRLIGGDLASFHSTDEENYIKNRTGNIGNGFWIGLHDRSSETGFEWTDESVVDYVAWGEGEPNNNQGIIGEDCVEMYFDGRGWNDKECTSLNGWVCQIARGKVPGNTPAPPPSLPPYTPCPTAEDWVLEGDYCYYFSAGANMRLGWNDANSWCMENGGYLVSIHGSDEQDKLNYYAQTYTYNYHWIGIREYDIDGSYVWADGSPLDFQNWREGEPNDANGEEQCGEMAASDGYWSDLNCGDSQPFICKRVYHEIIPKTYPPTDPPTGNCPSGWDQYGYRCYKIYGYTQSEQRSWYDGRDNCQAQGGELVIIHSQEIQSYIISQMKEVTFSIYIGLSDITSNGQFRWVDGTPVDYTNWDGREPNEARGGEDCVEMLYRYGEAGRWNDIGCTNPKGYICQRNVDPSYPQQPPDDNDCDTGYVQYYESCFKLLKSASDFATAGATCQNDGYYLASIHDQHEQAFVETLMYSNGDDPVWIGMRKDNNGEYTWVDGWPTFYTNWGFQEPSQGLNEGCVVISREGTWDDTNCDNNYGAVCKYTSLAKPTNPPDTPGTCPDNWMASGNDCFLVRASPLDLASFPEAQYICRGYGAELASIHSSLENKLIYDAIAITLTDVWLGMDRTLDGPYKWVDGTPVNYLNWAPNEPSYVSGDTDELCVEMYPGSGLWNDRECLQKQGFVCRASKYALNPTNPPVITGTRVTEPQGTTRPGVTRGTNEQTGLSGGGIAGIVIAAVVAVCLAAVVIFFFVTRSKSPSVAKDPGLPPSVGFDNALYTSSNKEGKVQIGSLDPTSLDEQI